jgi:hypothetical protein
MPDQPYFFSRRAAQRITAAVRRIEKQTYNFRLPSQRPTVAMVPYIECITSGALPAFNTSTNSPGVGTAQPYIPIWNPNTNSYLPTLDPSLGTNGATTVKILNFHVGASLSGGTRIGAMLRNGNYQLTWMDS